MILFKNDIPKYPTVIFDVNTVNTSWVRVSGLLKVMGIKNHYFFLALYDRELQGVDPYSPHLTTDQKTRIALEVKYNPFYFFREVFRISDGGHAVPFELSRPALAVWWCLFCGIDIALLLARQCGKSVTVDAAEVWLLNYYYTGTEMLLFTKDEKLRVRNIMRLKKEMNLLPTWLNPQIKSGLKKDSDNTEGLTCNLLGNELKCEIGQAVSANAENVARGGTIPFFHDDEGPWTVNIKKSLPVIQMAMGTARANYERSGRIHAAIYTTTAGKKDSVSGKYMYNFIHSGMPWNEMLYDCADKYEAREIVIKASPGGKCLVNATLSHRVAGKTDDWVRQRMSAVETSIEELERDYLNIWSSGDENPALTREQLEIIDGAERDPVYCEVTKDKYMLKWYIPQHEIHDKMRTGYFGLGIDSSEALGRDANGVKLTDFRDMATIASAAVSVANLHDFGLWVADLLLLYPNVTLTIEKKSSAMGILDTIAAKLIPKGINPFKRIYNRIVDNQANHKELFDEVMAKPDKDLYEQNKQYFGFNTTSNLRQFLYGTVLNDAVNSTGHLTYDKILCSELKGLIIKNGRVDHQEDGHDDQVIAWLLNHWFVKHTKNLSAYGINQLYCLSMVSSAGTSISEEEALTKQIINALKNDIMALKERLLAAPSVTESIRDERLIKIKVDELLKMGDDTLSLDAIMNEVSKSKITRQSLRSTLNSLNFSRLNGSAYKR